MAAHCPSVTVVQRPCRGSVLSRDAPAGHL